MAEQLRLDTEARQELSDNVVGWIQEEMFQRSDTVKEQESFSLGDHLSNWYQGFTEVSIIHVSDNGYQTFSLKTTSTAATISTPYLRQEFSDEKFKPYVDYDFTFYQPDNITKYNNVSLEMEILVDIKETLGGSEEGKTCPLGKPTSDFRCESMKGQNKTKTLLFDVTNKKNKGFASFKFKRGFSDKVIREWETKRITGMKINWEYKDNEGTSFIIPAKQKYVNGKENINFIRIVNLMNEFLTRGFDFELLWDKVKQSRGKYIVGQLEKPKIYQGTPFNCHKGMLYYPEVNLILSDIEQKLNITAMPAPDPDQDMEEKTLKEAAKLFLFIAFCPISLKRSTDWMSWTNFYTGMTQKH